MPCERTQSCEVPGIGLNQEVYRLVNFNGASLLETHSGMTVMLIPGSGVESSSAGGSERARFPGSARWREKRPKSTVLLLCLIYVIIAGRM